MSRLFLLILVPVCSVLSGCLHKTVQIASEPLGASIYVNDEYLAKTPCELEMFSAPVGILYKKYSIVAKVDGSNDLQQVFPFYSVCPDTVIFRFPSEVIPPKPASTPANAVKSEPVPDSH